jgi:hypothetical protein
VPEIYNLLQLTTFGKLSTVLGYFLPPDYFLGTQSVCFLKKYFIQKNQNLCGDLARA